MSEEKKEINSIEFTTALVEDARAIREVQDTTWMATYPNAEYGITREDIAAQTTARFEERVKSATERLVNPNGEPCFVAKDRGRVVGFCWPWLSDEKGRTRVGSLYILPEYQDRGIGGKLLTRGLEWLGHERDIYLQVTTFNTRAKSFYERFGFTEVGPGDEFKLPTGKVMPTILLVKHKSV